MKLFYREIGNGKENLIIIHGLYGASDNWVQISKKISEKYRVFLIDLRNHGQSPHSDDFSIELMSDDLAELYDTLNISNAIIVGHSLGGRVAMTFATTYPNLIKKLIVVDISPINKVNTAHFAKHQRIIKFLLSIDLSKSENRQDALRNIENISETKKLLFFMMKNIIRLPDGSLKWKLNIKSIADNLSKILVDYSVNLSKIECKTLFIKGGASDYILQSDVDYIKDNIKDVIFETIPNTSHWLHAEQPDKFVRILNEFCK